MTTRHTDVLVIGSGFGGAAPALRLAEAGYKVTVLEKGPPIDPLKDFKQTQDPKYLLTYLKGIAGDNLSVTYAEALGGGSGFYEMVSLRAPSQAFEQTDRYGRRLWPAQINRETLDPYYDIAEQMLRVEQIDEREVPKSGLVFSLLMKKLGYSVERARYAVQNCRGSGFCVTGCIYGAKQSLLLNYLPRAVEAGATIETELEATAIKPRRRVRANGTSTRIDDLPYRYEVRCTSSGNGRNVRFLTKMLILGGGTIGTARLLLNSQWYLDDLSDQVGRNIAFNGSVKTAGLLPDWCPDGDMFTGRSHPGMVSYEFLESHGIMISAAKPLPLQAVAAARLRLDGDGSKHDYWGAPNVELMKKFRRRVIVLVAFGMTPPLGRLRWSYPDRFDLNLELTADLRKYYKKTKKLLDSIITRNGGRRMDAEFINRDGTPYKNLHFATAHQVGSCRMADSRAHGVIAPSGEVYGYPGMYVTDGAAIPTSLAVNTSLTILANAERIAAGILEQYGTGASRTNAHAASSALSLRI